MSGVTHKKLTSFHFNEWKEVVLLEPVILQIIEGDNFLNQFIGVRIHTTP